MTSNHRKARPQKVCATSKVYNEANILFTTEWKKQVRKPVHFWQWLRKLCCVCTVWKSHIFGVLRTKTCNKRCLVSYLRWVSYSAPLKRALHLLRFTCELFLLGWKLNSLSAVLEMTVWVSTACWWLLWVYIATDRDE